MKSLMEFCQTPYLSITQFIQEAFNDAGNGDEFYTRLEDIEKELSNYNFNDSVVYCNCDDPSFSNFWKYFKENFDKLGLKLLLSTYYSDDPKLTIFDGKDIQEKSIESGLFQDNMKYINKFKVDWVVTNPPYSGGAPLELTEQLLRRKVNFIFCGPLHLLVNKEFFKLFRLGKVSCGYTNINSFTRPDGKTMNAPSAWFTNIDIDKPKYVGKGDGSGLPKYDDINAIECNPSSKIPSNKYKDKMGVPYRFLTKINRDQFDILDIVTPKLNGKKKMKRILIQYKR